MPTIKDVASLAGVSVSTVSLMLNGKKSISTEKYNRILEAMKTLNYRPSLIAQNLKKQQLHLIGVILPSMEFHYAQIFQGLYSVLNGKKYYIIVKCSDNNIQKEKECYEELLALGVTGMVVCPCRPDDVGAYGNKSDSGMPIVYIERKVENAYASNVLFDNNRIVYSKTQELLCRMSPEDIMLITGPLKFSSEADCKRGFEEAVLKTRPAYDINDLRIMETSFQLSHSLMSFFDTLKKMEKIPKAFIVSDYQLSLTLGEVLQTVKEDAEIYALTGDVWSQIERTKLPIRSLPREAMKMGMVAADMLMEFIERKHVAENRDIVIDCDNYYLRKSVPLMVVKECKRPLQVLIFKTNFLDALVRMSVNFTKETGIPVEYTQCSYTEVLREIIKDKDRKVPKYDVVDIDMPWINTAIKNDYIKNIRPFIDKKDKLLPSKYTKGLQKLFFGRQRVYGVPILGTTGFLYYRKDLFEDPSIKWSFYKKYGIELCPPRTWTEFNYTAEFFNREKNPESPVKYGTLLSGQAPVGFMEEFYVRQWAFNGRMFDKWGKLNINSIENIRAVESMAATFANAPKECFDMFYDEVFEGLLRGEAAFIQGFPPHYLPFRNGGGGGISDFDARIVTAPIPGGKPMLGSWLLSMTKSDMQDEAFEYMRWAADEALAVTNTLMGGTVPLQKIYSNTLLNEYYPWLRMFDAMDPYEGIREDMHCSDGDILDQFTFEQIMSEGLIPAMKGEMAAAEAVEKLHRIVERLLTDSDYRKETERKMLNKD